MSIEPQFILIYNALNIIIQSNGMRERLSWQVSIIAFTFPDFVSDEAIPKQSRTIRITILLFGDLPWI
jgi:hypothetical protein